MFVLWFWLASASGSVFPFSSRQFLARAHALHCLEVLTFGLYGWGDYHLDLVHVLDSEGATDPHRRAQSTDEILSAISCRGRAKKELF